MTVKTPMMIDGKMPETRMETPRLGEHTIEVLKECGYNDEEARELLKKGIAVQQGVSI